MTGLRPPHRTGASRPRRRAEERPSRRCASDDRLMARDRHHGHNGDMKNANISDLRNHLSEYLRRVRKGEAVLICDRERPIARLEHVGAAGCDLPSYYHEAVKSGFVRPPQKRDDALRTFAPPSTPKRPAGLVEALIAERRAGR